MKKIVFLSIALVLLMACNKNENPLLVEQDTPFGVPAFDKVKIEHYMPAFKAAIAANEAEIDAIVNNPEAPTFANTIEALDRSGELLDKVVGVFFNVLEADGNDEMNKIAEEVTPLLSELSDGIILIKKLINLIQNIMDVVFIFFVLNTNGKRFSIVVTNRFKNITKVFVILYDFCES